jgi:hypothetical protein
MWVRSLAAGALLAGLLVVWVLGIALQRSPATTAATAAHCLDRQALARFQLARSTDDLLAVFGPPASPCRPLAVDALAATQHADFQVLIPAYTVFFLAAALALAGSRGRWAWLAIIAALVAATANGIEDGIQLRLIESMRPPQPGPPAESVGSVGSAGSLDGAAALLAPLTVATLTKFTAFAVYAALVGIWALGRPHRGWPEWLLGLCGLLPLPATLVGAVAPQRLGFVMALTFLVFAIVLAGTLVRVLVRPSGPWGQPAIGAGARLS